MSEPTGPAKPRSTRGSAKDTQEVAAADPQTSSAPGVPQPGADPAPGPGPSEAPTSAIPAPTQPLPAAATTAPAALPGFSEAAPAGRPPVGPPTGSPSGPPSGPPPVGPAAGGPAGPPPKRPGLWRQATSTTGGLIAVIVAGALCALLVLGVVATLGLVAVRVAGHDGPSRMERVRDDGMLPPGQQRKLDRMPQGPDSPRGPGNGKGNGPGDDLGDGNGNGMGNGMGPLLRGAMGLGAVQHGEFTVQQNGAAVVMTLQRGVVTKASATSVTVKSGDNLTATYAIADDTRGRTRALAVGDSVLVVAEKTGAKAVFITATPRA